MQSVDGVLESIPCMRKKVHKKFLGIKGNLAKVKIFECDMYETNQVSADSLKSVNMVEDLIKNVKMFCYLRNVLRVESGVQKIVIARIRARWNRFVKDGAGVLCKKGLWIKFKGLLYTVKCISNVQ